MSRARDLAEVAQQLHVGRLLAEIIIADQASIGLPAELAELLFVYLLEQSALVPGGIGELPQVPIELVLRDVHDADLEHRVGFGVKDEVIQTAPGTLDLLKLRRMHDLVHLRREFLVQLGDHFLDGVEDVAFNETGVGERLLDESIYRVLDLGGRALRARLEALLQQCGEFIGFAAFDPRLLWGGGGCCFGRHGRSLRFWGYAEGLPSPSSASSGASAARFFSAAMSWGSASNLRNASSAATLPSM